MTTEPEKAGARAARKRKRFLGEFEYPSYEQWREVAETSLKGAPFDKKLLTKTYEGITLQPIYNPEDVAELSHLDCLPGSAPFVRGTKSLGNSVDSWEVCLESTDSTPWELNKVLMGDLRNGGSAVNLVLDLAGKRGKDPQQADPDEVGRAGVSIIGVADIARIFQDIDPAAQPLYAHVGSAGMPFAALLVAHLKHQRVPLESLRGCIETDPLGMLARDGSLTRPLKQIYDEMAMFTRWATKQMPHLQTICVHGHPYHEAGGSAVEELAFALATGVDYLREMLERNLSIDEVASRVRFSFSIGGNLFMEVAKLRAARLVWSQVVQSFGGSEESCKMTLHARTSAWTKTVYDPYVNLLRSTTESFSAAIAGADSIHTSAFDEPIRGYTEFSRRIARNTQILLHEESHINQVVDPAGGSWYVEYLTDAVASRAWSLFQDVEKSGGMKNALVDGLPQRTVAGTAELRNRDFATRKSVMIGTNIYPNKDEELPAAETIDTGFHAKRAEQVSRIKEMGEGGSRGDLGLKLDALAMLEPDETFDALVQIAGLDATIGEISRALANGEGELVEIAPLAIHRGAQMYETLRRAVDAYCIETGGRPKIFLANMGPLSQHKARADFTTGFFEVGGFELCPNPGFATPEEAARAAAQSGAAAVVICSTDETYPDIVPRFMKAFSENRPEMTVVLAGFPTAQIDAHRLSGVEEFIHLKANNYEMNLKILQKIGVEL